MDYNAATNRYTESTAPVTQHSPILAWAADGLPVYGPYGYSSPLDPNSGVRRMVSGFVLRNGKQRHHQPHRPQRPCPRGHSGSRTGPRLTTQYGPAVNATYLLGHYIEDFDYLGDPARPRAWISTSTSKTSAGA